MTIMTAQLNGFIHPVSTSLKSRGANGFALNVKSDKKRQMIRVTLIQVPSYCNVVMYFILLNVQTMIILSLVPRLLPAFQCCTFSACNIEKLGGAWGRG